MEIFTFYCPTRIYFGENTAASACDLVREAGGKKTLIVTDANLIKAGVLKKVLRGFESSENQPVIFDDVPPDSDVGCVKKAVAVARAAGCDSIVAVGGGSVLDTAKVVNICLSYGGDMLEYQGLNNLPTPLLPLLAIPTTAGTGSEVSLVAMIKDSAEGKKLLFGSSHLAPNVAVLDPELIRTLPPGLTAATGLDALTHDLESYVALSSTSPMSDALCVESARLLFQHLPRATSNGEDMEARSATLAASTMAGVAFTNTGVGIVHALAHTVGAHFGTHHGMTNAVFLPHGMEFNLPQSAHRYASLARSLGISQNGDDTAAASDLIKAVRNLISVCGLPHRLRDLGVPETSDNKLNELAFEVETDPAIMFNPREASAVDIIDIYKRAY